MPRRDESRVPAPLAVLLAAYALTLTSAYFGWTGAFVMSGLAACAVHWHVWQHVALSRGGVLAAALAMRLGAFPMPPRLSDDTYRYVWDGLLTISGVNPYRYRPADEALAAFQDLPIFDLLNSPAYFSVYPPLSQGLFAAGAWLGDGSWATAYFATKALFALLEVGGLVLLARLVAPERLALYALHPLAALETAGQGHTEAALVLALVATVAATRRGRGALAGLAITAAGWVKLYPFLVLPFILRRFGRRAAAAALAVSVVLVLPFAAAYAPVHALTSLRLYVRLFEFNPGPYLVLREALALVLGYNPIRLLGPVLAATLLVALAAHFVQTARRPWPIERTIVWVLGAYLLTATTVHPWYLLGVLAVLPLCPRVGPHWWWLAAASFGTYLRYEPGAAASFGYWAFVVGGWGGAAAIAFGRDAYRAPRAVLRRVLRRRGAAKAERILPHLPSNASVRPSSPDVTVLDLGAGEGWVGRRLADRGARVVLADVLPPPSDGAPGLPYVRYDGRTLPFDDASFDAVVLYFVLHHAAEPEAVLREALRVARSRVIVMESVYTSEGERRRLAALDRLANRLRLEGALREQEPHVHFRRADTWRALFEASGARVVHEATRGRWVHRQHLFVLAPTPEQ